MIVQNTDERVCSDVDRKPVLRTNADTFVFILDASKITFECSTKMSHNTFRCPPEALVLRAAADTREAGRAVRSKARRRALLTGGLRRTSSERAGLSDSEADAVLSWAHPGVVTHGRSEG